MIEEVVLLRKEIGARIGAVKRQDKLLAEIESGAKNEDVARIAKALDSLAARDLAGLGLAERAGEVSEVVRRGLGALRRDRRLAVGRELREACEAAGRTFRRLAEQPPEFLLEPFTVVLDLELMEAEIRFAREPLLTVSARADDILAGLERADKGLRAREAPAEEWLASLLQAYRAALARRGASSGERVELVEVLPEMAFLRQPARFRENPVKERFAPYSKARFLYDLARLRTSRRLEVAGLRLDLGTATGTSARKKSRVFFLQGAGGEGQYYLTLRFVPVAGGGR